MTDESEEKSAQGGKVIEGGVAAQAGSAEATLNQATRFCVQERVHHRYACDPASGRELQRHTLLEYVVTFGDPPEKWCKFQGLGFLTANTPPPPMGMGTIRREYRFNILSDSLEEAWSKFEGFNERGAAQAEEAFRREFAEWSNVQAQRLAVVQGPGAAQALLGPDGRPTGLGG